MALPVMSSGRSLLRFRLLGVPVRVDVWFLVLFVFLGYVYGFSTDRIVLWVLIAGASILVHEMGHALVARSAGAEPVVELHGMGGLTSWSGGESVSRARLLSVSIAGPGLGMLLGIALLGLRRQGLGDASEMAQFAFDQAIWVNLGWGVFNLLPVLPLDGGQVMRDLLPGDLARRQRTAAAVSVCVATGAALMAFSAGWGWAGVFAGFFAITNLTTLRASRPSELPPDVARLHEAQRLMGEGSVAEGVELARQVADQSGSPDAQAIAAQVAAQGLLRLGRAGEAKLLLIDLPVGSVDPVLEAQVLAATGQVDVAIDRLRSTYTAAPDGRGAFALAQLLARNGRAGEVLWIFAGADPELTQAAASGADAGGAPDVAARLRAASAAS